MADADSGESIAIRVSRLNQLFAGRAAQLLEHKALVSREGLLDALLVLYEECCSEHLRKNEYIGNFVKKYAKTVRDLKRLRISIGDFEVKNIIGRGHFGEVQVVREKHSADVYALKVLRKADTLAQQNVAFYEEERDIMAKSHSPWITQLQYAFQDKINLYLVMEFHPGGDLLSLLSRYDDVFEENMARFYLAEMILAIHALHTMGYVHRDVKPENILIDRTGHVKLADFGSACRMDDDNSSVSNMPVGTPDYISPEVLTKMNSNDTRGRFGPECDWWSLGICTYEMLFGKTPFTDEKGSMVTTYANIMNFKKTLKFPSTVEVSQNALDLIKRLLSDAQKRMDYESICVHNFFSETNFDGLRMSSPPFIPTITSKDDTSNFDEFEKVRPKPVVDDLGKRTVFSGKDLPFIGFTFTKSLSGMERPSLTKEVSSPACKASLERRLTMKSKELQDLRDRCKTSEHREASLKGEVQTLQKQFKDRGCLLQKVEAERDELERNMAHYISEVSSLKRICDSEKQERQSIDDKADKLLKELQEQAELAQKLRDEQYRDELEQYQDLSDKLQEDNNALLRKVEKLERELKTWKRNHEDKEEMVAQLEVKVTQMRQNSQSSCQELTSELQSRENDFAAREEELQSQINKALERNVEATTLLKQVRESKNDLEQEMYQLKMKQGIDEALIRSLSDSEEKRRSMETQMHKLQIMEKRERLLKEELKEKGSHILQLAERIAELENSLENRELEYKKCEKLYSQREEQHLLRVQDLEEQVDQLRQERCNIQEESLMVFEENEDRLRVINEQESTITLLKANVFKLEEQMFSLKTDIEERAMPTPRKRTPRKSRRSGFCQTDSVLLSSPSANRRKSGSCQTEPTRRCSGTTQTDMPSPPKMPCNSKRSFVTQTDSSCSPRKPMMTTSTDCQTDDLDSSFGGRRHRISRKSGATQTDRSPSPGLCVQTERWSPKRKANSADSAASPRKIVSRFQTKTTDTSTSSCRVNESLTNISVTVKVKRRSGDDDSETTTSTEDSSLTTITEKEEDSTDRCPVAEEEDWDDDSDDEDEEEDDLWDVSEEEEDSKKQQPKKTFFTRGSQTEIELDDKEWKRKQEETQSDLRQEKKYLETKVGTLEKEIQQIRDKTHEQRVRALDLKHELREKSLQYEKQIDDLKAKLNKTELSLSDATETTLSLQEKEAMMKNRLDKIQKELDTLKIESRRNLSTLNEDKDELEAQVKLLKAKTASLESSEAEMRRGSDEKKIKLQRAEQQVKELLPLKQDLDERLRVALEEKGRLKLTADKTQSDLNEKRRQCEMTEQKLSQLKDVCVELEAQVRDYETLNKRYESKEAKWTKDSVKQAQIQQQLNEEVVSRNTYEKAVDERENEVENTNKQLQLEKMARQRAEEKQKELNNLVASMQESYKNEIARLKKQLNELKIRLDTSNGQLTQKEREYGMLQVEVKTLRRKVEALEEEGVSLKEEISRHITKSNELKGSNLRLGKNLEEAMDKYELLQYKKTDLENQMETADINFSHEKYKLESTLAQQTKLIDYLQEKIENPPKKRKGLFGNKRQDQAVVSIQFRELQHHLDNERDKSSTLRQQVTKLKDELYQAKTETIRLKCRSENDIPKTFSTLSTPGPSPALSALVLSPASQPSPGASTNSVYSDAMSVPKTPSTRPKKERMHHNIPHRFVTGLNSRATTCAVCLGSVHFVKQAAKCQECEVVCHPKCAPSLPSTCGIPTEYVRHFTDTMTRAKAVSTSKLSVADLRLQMRGWMKLPRHGTQVWERKYVVLENNKLNVYNNENTDSAAIEEFNLCPHNGEVSIHSAVTPAELTNTATSDLPFVLRLEFEPNTTCWPGRSLYLMALSFPDKQKWVAKLEAIVNHSGKEERIRDTKLLGNTILSLAGKARIDINCTLPLRGQMVLFGADEGLFVIDISTSKAKPMVKVEGVGSVHMMSAIKGMDCVAIVVGKDRDLIMVDMNSLERCMCQNSQYGDRPSVLPKLVKEASAVTTFVLGSVAGAVFLCVATADKVLIFKHNQGLDNFCLRKEVVTPQACSCMLFARNFVLMGADKFYKIDLHSYTLSEFIDKADQSLSFAAFDAANYDSFPISVLQIGRREEAEEFLLCFHEFGIFVDIRGRRTREKDMKWSGLPLNFAYQAPYLYIIHFNTLQVIEIMPRHYESPQGSKTFLNVPSPRYLGPALTSGAIYIGSSHENKAETICFKGNMNSQTAEDKENTDLYATPAKRKPRSTKKPQPPVPTPNYSTTDTESGFVSPDSDRTRIRRMSCSPRRRKPSVVSQTSTTSSECSSTDIDCNTNTTSVKATIQMLEKRRRRRAAHQDSDSSY